ncbi:MAG: hypothetical protein HYY04_18685 [Chloroflexi bacterium]|nr:hypothetical protein [Chloroflexota bacterium]
MTAYPPRLLPYFQPESDFWRMYPGLLARDFARFVALAERGQPEPFDQLTLAPGERVPPAEHAESFREQQRRHFTRSVRSCREVLGLGERDR